MSPLAIFDSGLGGLSIARQFRRLMPQASILYCGDTAHAPYGNRSAASITARARKLIRHLVERGIREIVIACNTVCATALSALNAEFGLRAQLIEVLQPGVSAALARSSTGKIAVLATKATVSSGAYARALRQRCREISVLEIPCPQLATHIERNLADERATRQLLARYLKPLDQSTLTALLLGCTHYSFVKSHLDALLGRDIVVDPARACALAIVRALAPAAQNTPTARGRWEWLFTDSPELWIARAELLLGPADFKRLARE